MLNALGENDDVQLAYSERLVNPRSRPLGRHQPAARRIATGANARNVPSSLYVPCKTQCVGWAQAPDLRGYAVEREATEPMYYDLDNPLCPPACASRLHL